MSWKWELAVFWDTFPQLQVFYPKMRSDRSAVPVTSVLLTRSATHGSLSFLNQWAAAMDKRSKRGTTTWGEKLIWNKIIIIARDCNCQVTYLWSGVIGVTFGPGLRLRASYSLTARRVVNQSLPIFLPSISLSRTNKRRWLWENPLIVAAMLSGINSSRLGWYLSFPFLLPDMRR